MSFSSQNYRVYLKKFFKNAQIMYVCYLLKYTCMYMCYLLKYTFYCIYFMSNRHILLLSDSLLLIIDCIEHKCLFCCDTQEHCVFYT